MHFSSFSLFSLKLNSSKLNFKMKQNIPLKKNLSIIPKLWTELSFLFERKQCNEFYTDVSIERAFLKVKTSPPRSSLEQVCENHALISLKGVCCSWYRKVSLPPSLPLSVAKTYVGEPSLLLNTRGLLEVTARLYPSSFDAFEQNLGKKISFSCLHPLCKQWSGGDCFQIRVLLNTGLGWFFSHSTRMGGWSGRENIQWS